MDAMSVFRQIVAGGMARVMVVRSEEMAALKEAAEAGDADALFRLSSTNVALNPIRAGHHSCLFCDQKTTDGELAAITFVAEELAFGHPSVFFLCCTRCDEPDPAAMVKKVTDRLGFKRIVHEAGHA